MLVGIYFQIPVRISVPHLYCIKNHNKMNNKSDDGRKVKRIQEILGMKQGALALNLKRNR
jgi:hypothetical protein